ncbi:collagen alpha-1(XXI) chain [Callorhinchus milii]|uniref:collagen alpha-1(XXI) chain n=1 Tax=Callorhinchus milii TaxID=7868 RepID=UPI001C3F526B|nr:collagen alpha-1(XXI) chain [Callorhinchus milii]
MKALNLNSPLVRPLVFMLLVTWRCQASPPPQDLLDAPTDSDVFSLISSNGPSPSTTDSEKLLQHTSRELSETATDSEMLLHPTSTKPSASTTISTTLLSPNSIVIGAFTTDSEMSPHPNSTNLPDATTESEILLNSTSTDTPTNTTDSETFKHVNNATTIKIPHNSDTSSRYLLEKSPPTEVPVAAYSELPATSDCLESLDFESSAPVSEEPTGFNCQYPTTVTFQTTGSGSWHSGTLSPSEVHTTPPAQVISTDEARVTPVTMSTPQPLPSATIRPSPTPASRQPQDPGVDPMVRPSVQQDVNSPDKCGDSAMDLVFLLDGSKSVLPQNFEKVKDFVNGIVDSISIGRQGSRVGVVQYSSNVRTEFTLDQHRTKEEIKEAVKRISYMQEGTATGRAIRHLIEKSFSGEEGARCLSLGVRRVAIVVTDGRSADDVTVPARAAHHAGIVLFTIGVTGSTDETELRAMASQPHSQYLHHVDDFNLLEKVKLQLAGGQCKLRLCQGTVGSERAPGVDFLKEFQVSESEDITQVNGSQPQNTAFRLSPSVQLKKEMGDLYPDGIPSEYSIIATFKMLGDASRSIWNLWEVSDADGREQVGIRFFGDSKSLDFFYRTPSDTLMFQTFTTVDVLFDGSWHKLLLSVKKNEITLLIDCKEVSTAQVNDKQPISGNGYTSIAKRALEDSSVSLDLQQLELYCNADKAFSEGCCELSDLCDGSVEYSLAGDLPHCKCSHGQPGAQGSTGPQGQEGQKGTAGEPGRPGNQGIRGDTGAYGRFGDTGPQGIVGIKGNKGVSGRPGQSGVPGPKGYKGFQGGVGFKGVLGEPGARGEVGPKGEKGARGIVGQEGIWGFPGIKGDEGFHGVKGDQGPPGTRGLVGDPGLQGYQGTKGKPGLPGFSGNKGDTGPKGTVGDPGQPGRDGIPGIEAYQGKQGQKGRQGSVGPKGEKGYPGHRGLEGPMGKTGQKGQKGDTGIPARPGFFGNPGIQGHEGDPGVKGSKGKPGSEGAQGREGQKGEKGSKGPKGEPGDLGQHGPLGHKGNRGTPGETGNRGPLGERGVTGDVGPAGYRGPAGPPGPILAASHVIEVCKKLILEQMSMFTNIVRRKCTKACPLYGDVPMGPPGPVGENGMRGVPGNPGINGQDGEQGLEGFYGEVGDPGTDGPKGEEGVRGDKGSRGVGLPGFIGEQGARGERGRKGSSIPGQPGQHGPRGHRGQHGLRGHQGPMGTPGVCLARGCDLGGVSDAAIPNETENRPPQRRPLPLSQSFIDQQEYV